MPKNIGLYNNNLSVPRKQDIDNVQTELIQLTEDVDDHIGNYSNPHEVTKAQIGLNNVDNVQQYSINNPPPYPVTSVNSKTGAVSLSYSDVNAVPTTRTINGQALSSDVALDASDVGALSTSGGTLTGNLTGKFLTGTWLQSTSVTDLNSNNYKGICVFDGSGWIYYRTLSEILSDIEAAPAYTYGTSDLTAGSSPLATGKLYLVYE